MLSTYRGIVNWVSDPDFVQRISASYVLNFLLLYFLKIFSYKITVLRIIMCLRQYVYKPNSKKVDLHAAIVNTMTAINCGMCNRNLE